MSDLTPALLILVLIALLAVLPIGLVALVLGPAYSLTRRLAAAHARNRAEGIEVLGTVIAVRRARGVVYRSVDGDPYFIDLELTLPTGEIVAGRAFLVGLPPAIAPYCDGARVRGLVRPDALDFATLLGQIGGGAAPVRDRS